jgi:branched-chain amino acid transport system substrate-binding protein
VRRLALAVLLTSASLFVCPQPARGAWGAKPPSSKKARHSLAGSVAPVPERSSPQDASVPVGPSPQDAPVPFKAPSQVPLDFRGPGREEPEPNVDEVVFGWFGPGDPDHPDFGDFWRGAILALEQENGAGGYRGKLPPTGPSVLEGRPFRLVPSWSESPWAAAVVDVTRTVYERGAWAVIGGVDGTTTHLAVQIALKSHFLLLSPGSTDVSADRANVPWLFSLPPSDERQATVLVEGLAKAGAGGSFVVAAATDHDSHATLVAARREMAIRRLTPGTIVEFAADEPDIAPLAARLVAGRPRAVLVLAPSRAAGRLVAAFGRAGFHGTILGGATAARAAFRRAAGPAAEGVVAPLPAEPGPAWGTFARAYEARWEEPPDDAAAHAYDAVRLAAEAVRRAGLNRVRIRDAMRALAPWPGASGTVSWNALGRNERAMALGSWNDGRLRVVRRP